MSTIETQPAKQPDTSKDSKEAIPPTEKKSGEDLSVLSALDKTVTAPDDHVTTTQAEILQQEKLKAEVTKAQLEAKKAKLELENLKNKPTEAAPIVSAKNTPAPSSTEEVISPWSMKGIIKQIQESSIYTKTLATFGVSAGSINTITNIVVDAETDKEGWSFSRLTKLFSSGWDFLKSWFTHDETKKQPEQLSTEQKTLASQVEKITREGDFQVLKDEIASKESGTSQLPYYSNPYDAYNRGNAGATDPIPEIPISQMSFDQVRKKQLLPFGTKGRLNAVGKYQATEHGLEEARKFFKFSKDAILTPDVQEKIGDYLLLHKRPTCRAYFSGASNDLDGVLKELALEFSSIPDPFKMRTKYQKKGGYKDLKGAGGNARYKTIKQMVINARKDLLNPNKDKKIPQYMTAISVEKNLKAKEKTTPYINLSQKNKKKTIEKQLFELNYPATLFVDNGKHNPEELQKQTLKIKELYKTQNKTVNIFMDNEGGTVQRVREYAGKAGPTENEIQNLLNEYVPQAGSLRKGKPSIRSMEKLFLKFSPAKQTDIMTKYAQLRIHQEKTLGLNSVSLVLDKGADKPNFKNKEEEATYNKNGDVINVRGFENKEIRKRYAHILISEAEKAGQKVLLKHFPGHNGIPNPHFQPLGTKKEVDEEMETFLEILDIAQQNGNKNIIVMLGHIKLDIPNTEWNSEGKPIFASKKIMDKLHARYPNITFMTDDIGGMDAIKQKTEARENAQKNNVYALN